MSVACLGQTRVCCLYLVSSAALALAVMLSAASRQWLPSQPARMRLFMHDVLSGPGVSAMGVVNGTGPVVLGSETQLRFGQVVMIDDALTEGPSPGSRPLGRAQGFYAFASMRGPAFLFCMNVVLTAGPYSGNTFTVVGHDDTVKPVRELSVVGGTGRFRMATGYVLWRTFTWELHNNAVLDLDVFLHLHAHASA